MENLVLSDKLPRTPDERPPFTGRSWTEEIPPGTRERSSGTADYCSARKTLNIKIAGSWRNVRDLIKQTLGFSEVFPVFDPNNAAQQGPYQLSRTCPARHPRLKGMRCTQIVSWQGVGISKLPPTADTSGSFGDGHIGCPEFIYASLLFEVPRYPMLDDAEMKGYVHGVQTLRPEYVRHCEFWMEPMLETMARKGATWYFATAQTGMPQTVVTGEQYLRVPKAKLCWRWYDVAEDFVMLGKMAPVNYLKRLGTLNGRAFPDDAYRDQNKSNAAGNVVQFGPGTLLLLPPKITRRPMCHPAVLGNVEVGSLVKRGVEVEGAAIYFNPPSDDSTVIDLTSIGGSAMTPLRGHQLVPLVTPRVGAVAPNGLWYASCLPNPPPAPRTPPTSDTQLLHTYTDWEGLFRQVDSF